MTAPSNYLERAQAAYLRTVGAQQPSEALSSLQVANGHEYAVLRNVGGNLAVYRILPISKTLKRLKRWPGVLSVQTGTIPKKVKPAAIGPAPASVTPNHTTEKESA